DRAGPDTALSRVTLDVLYGRLTASGGDPALRARARAIGRTVTFGEPVLPRNPRKGEEDLPHYGWPSRTKLRVPAAAGAPVLRPVPLLLFKGEWEGRTVDGQPHPRPGLYLWAVKEASRLLGSVNGRVLEVNEDYAALEVMGVVHRASRHSFTWSPEVSLA